MENGWLGLHFLGKWLASSEGDFPTLGTLLYTCRQSSTVLTLFRTRKKQRHSRLARHRLPRTPRAVPAPTPPHASSVERHARARLSHITLGPYMAASISVTDKNGQTRKSISCFSRCRHRRRRPCLPVLGHGPDGVQPTSGTTGAPLRGALAARAPTNLHHHLDV